jgi:hypothetical protein
VSAYSNSSYTSEPDDFEWPIVIRGPKELIDQIKVIPFEDQTPLFGNWVEKTKYLQELAYGHKFEDMTIPELADWIRINVLAAEDELHEALAEVSWKPWAKSEFFNREAFLGEIVDVLHFVGNLLAGANISDEELNAAYLEKMDRNRKRQEEGYTGLDKCKVCKRAKDDIIAHGGSWIVGADHCTECAKEEL